ncbi:hypothetical protein BCR32DRAFT_290198 [Anaeromyces robustus]|uniref:Uncharacterized protein n=1 Tax=Anaeromyces robustus TaxID=1754192 RepID=A0A1Y1XKD0_9FUNG|nr:hypothetical protein BCR32DRAFT_290198 [Anaeromyces robustus]|eukprot:ORX86220.1 hypothetical protein BCR32DRAFT_290198 [Anaeromyces robustus]
MSLINFIVKIFNEFWFSKYDCYDDNGVKSDLEEWFKYIDLVEKGFYDIQNI